MAREFIYHMRGLTKTYTGGKKVLENVNLPLINWSLVAREDLDRYIDPKLEARRLSNIAQDGDIILMHDLRKITDNSPLFLSQRAGKYEVLILRRRDHIEAAIKKDILLAAQLQQLLVKPEYTLIGSKVCLQIDFLPAAMQRNPGLCD